MSSRLLRAAAASVALVFALALPVFAHAGGGASGISVEPAQVTAGGHGRPRRQRPRAEQ